MRGIFAATAFVAVCTALWVADASWQSGLLALLAMIIVPTMFARGAAISHGAWRAFFIGALVVMLVGAIPQTTHFFDTAIWLYVSHSGRYFDSEPTTLSELLRMISGYKRGVVALWVVAVLTGFIAQIVQVVIGDRTQTTKSRRGHDWRSLTAAALRGSPTHPTTADPALIAETKQEIRKRVIEITKLAKQDISASEFYGVFLDRVVSCLAASGGAIWTVDKAGGLKLAHRLNLPETLRDEKNAGFELHAALLRKTLAEGEGALIPPNRDQDHSNPGNPTDSLLVLGVLSVDLEPRGVVEIFQRVGSPHTTQRGYLKFVLQMCELANGYLRKHR